jgi:hypothetical protein
LRFDSTQIEADLMRYQIASVNAMTAKEHSQKYTVGTMEVLSNKVVKGYNYHSRIAMEEHGGDEILKVIHPGLSILRSD